MITPDIAGLCKRLDILHEWQSSPRDRETIALAKTTLERQAAERGLAKTTLERQAAENKRLRGENHDLRSIPWPRAYVLERASEWKRLLREIGGYVKTCRGSCGSDTAGRDHAIAATAEAVAMIESAEARAALTGEDAATLGLSGETQTDDRTRRDA
jgi:hypothetical protein